MKQTKILVVEDNEDHRRILVLRLQHAGQFEVREAVTGQEALDSIMREPPALVFLNLKLPVLDGWETARRIRALPAPLNQLRSEEHTSELQSRPHLVCRLLLEKKKK